MEVHPNSSQGGTQANFTTFASLMSGFLLLAIGFFAGWYWQNASVPGPVQVEIVERGTALPAPVTTPLDSETVTADEDMENCEFIGSKNSDKYHSPTSAPAKRILPENRVCFSSKAEAEEAGYEEGTLD